MLASWNLSMLSIKAVRAVARCVQVGLLPPMSKCSRDYRRESRCSFPQKQLWSGRSAMNESTTVLGHHFTNRIVKTFLESNLALILILLATIVGLTALGV